MKQELEKLQKDFKKSVDDVKDVLKLDEVYQRFFSRKSGEKYHEKFERTHW